MKLSKGKVILIVVVIYFIIFAIINVNKEKNFNDDTIYKDNEKTNLNFEILFLFNCSNSGHFKMEMEKLYSDILDEIEQILDKIYVPKNIIEKKEIMIIIEWSIS